MIVSIFTAIAGIIMLLSVLFNFPPYLGGKTWTLGFIDFKYGIPFTARFATGNIPDSTEFIKTPSGSSLHYFSDDFKEDTGKPSNETILSSNKIAPL